MGRPLISRDPGIQLGAYCIRGTRIPVDTIKTYYKAGDSVEILMNLFSLTREQVEAALDFREKR